MSWQTYVLSLNLRKALAYRVDFWISFLGSISTELLVAFFLWKAVFSISRASVMGGYSFLGMMFYYLLVPLVGRLVRGSERGFFSTEIYDGSLTRYLTYPVSYFGYKYVSSFAEMMITCVQALLMVGVFTLWVGVPRELHVGLLSVVEGILSSLAAAGMFFFLSACFEFVAFWAENVWSLTVILRFVGDFFGGSAIPLSFFPAPARKILMFLPFPYLGWMPIRAWLGQLSVTEWLGSIAMCLAWTAVFAGLAQLIWRRGTRQYSGVGM